MPTHCCPECFDDRGLRKDIIPSLSQRLGVCDYCGSAEVSLVEPAQLGAVFDMLAGIYEPDSSGRPLVEWLREDWKLFSHAQMSDERAGNLVAAILEDANVVRKTFVPSPAFSSEVLVRWETLRDELMYRNRYFLDEALDADRLEQLLTHLPADLLPVQWFRARIQTGDAPFGIEEMGAPPKELAMHGRANPTGIPYLYLGSTPETAVSETRPHTGESACVAEFVVEGAALRAVDLRNPRHLVSPFVLAGSSAIGQMRADIPFLERLGSELTLPVLPRSAAVGYVPSQYLCEFIKKSGYDGVVYRSSVSDGMNLALFNPQKAAGRAVSVYRVDRVSVAVTRM